VFFYFDIFELHVRVWFKKHAAPQVAIVKINCDLWRRMFFFLLFDFFAASRLLILFVFCQINPRFDILSNNLTCGAAGRFVRLFRSTPSPIFLFLPLSPPNKGRFFLGKWSAAVYTPKPSTLQPSTLNPKRLVSRRAP